MPEDDPTAVNALLEYLYTSDFTLPSIHDSYPDYTQATVLLVSVFHLADKYLMAELKDLAEEKFERLVVDGSFEADILAMIEAVEDPPVEVEDALHKFLVQEIAGSYVEIFTRPQEYKEIHAALSKRPMLALKAARKWAEGRSSSMKCYQCSDSECVGYRDIFEMPGRVKASGIVCPVSGCGKAVDVVE